MNNLLPPSCASAVSVRDHRQLAKMGNDNNNIPEAMVRGEEEEEEESEEEYQEAGGSQEASGSQKATGSKAKAAETNKYPCIKCQKSVQSERGPNYRRMLQYVFYRVRRADLHNFNRMEKKYGRDQVPN